MMKEFLSSDYGKGFESDEEYEFAPFDIIIRNFFIPSTPDHSGLFAQLIHALVEKYY